MGNFEYDQVKMALLAIQEHDEFQKKLLIHFTEQEALEDAKENDGVRGPADSLFCEERLGGRRPADTCFCKGCGFTDCDQCNMSVEVK